jgi:hypothetical protein
LYILAINVISDSPRAFDPVIDHACLEYASRTCLDALCQPSCISFLCSPLLSKTGLVPNLRPYARFSSLVPDILTNRKRTFLSDQYRSSMASPNTTSSHLPQELVDHIIDHLHDDPPALSSCARVCRGWLPTSRHHFFAKISLKATSAHNGPAVPQERCKQLYAVLTQSPEITYNIRELEICEGSPHHHHDHHPELSSTTWITTERTLTALFKMLTHLQRLDFSATSILYWKLLPPTFQSALWTLLSLPTLTYIRLHSWVFPDLSSLASILARCHNLNAFALSSTNILNEGSNNSPQLRQTSLAIEEGVEEVRPPRTRLEVLTLDYVTFGYLDYWLLSPHSLIDITSLRELRVSHFQDATAIEKLLLTVDGSLEHFHLKPGYWDGKKPFPLVFKAFFLFWLTFVNLLLVHSFNLSYNSGLRSIRLTLENPETAMHWATNLLSSITSTNTALKNVGLEFFTDLKKLEGWVDLDSLFVQPELASLRQVEIGLFAIPTHSDFIKVKEEMSGLESRGIARWYQLGIKNQRSTRQLTPRISRYES